MHKLVRLASIAVISISAANTAGAATLSVTSVGAYHLGSLTVSGDIAGYGAFNKSVYGGPVILQGTFASGKAFSVVTFCFDVVHQISAGFGDQAPLAYTFSTAAISNDQSQGPGSGNPLTADQAVRMSGLAQLGADQFLAGSGDLDASLPAIQAAIWSIEYGVTATDFSNPGSLGLYNGYLAQAFTGNALPALIAKDAAGLVVGGQQGLLLGVGGVPEPDSWALMIVGFGVVGAMGRRRRPLVLARAG